MTDVPVRRPSVAREPGRAPLALAGAALALIGVGTFAALASGRAARADAEAALPPLALAQATTPAPLVLPAPPVVAAPAPVAPALVAVPPPALPPAPILAVRPAPVDTGAAERARARLRAPALIVDLAQADSGRATPPTESFAAARFAQLDPAAMPLQAAPPALATTPQPAAATTQLAQLDPGASPQPADRTAAAAAAALGVATPRSDLSDTERFSARVGGEEVDVAVAERIAGLDRLVPQGAIIAATMETAVNSDLPGFARAIVSRDVFSFDGQATLIPAGSRVIGQYKSGVAQGASRVFILWTRLIRPDGVSVTLGSPATDDLGRGGLAGKVDRHFLQRFGGAILLSVLSGGINAAAASVGRGSTVIVGTTGEATSLARDAFQGRDIPPTIKTPQGASVRIFVARDLNFSAVGPAS